jgi:hypothetical protein
MGMAMKKLLPFVIMLLAVGCAGQAQASWRWHHHHYRHHYTRYHRR